MTHQTETDCPTPETHNWGCGCPTDVAAAIASCPGHEVDGPSPCRCPCEGCKHNCAAHQPAPAAVSAAVAPPTNRAELRDRIAQALAREDAHNAGYDHGFVGSYGADDETDGFVDAVLAVLPSAADWDALVREADRLRRDGKALHARAEELDTQLAALRQQVTKPTDRDAVLREVADELTRKANKLTERVHDLAYFVAKDRLREAEILDREATELRRMADETATQTPEDTLPAWLYQRFMPDGIGWDQLDEEDRSYWEHQARAVRRAVARGGFKQPAAGARQDGAET